MGKQKNLKKKNHLVTTTITLSKPEETIAEWIGLPAVPEGSPSSLDRYWSPTYKLYHKTTFTNQFKSTKQYNYYSNTIPYKPSSCE